MICAMRVPGTSLAVVMALASCGQRHVEGDAVDDPVAEEVPGDLPQDTVPEPGCASHEECDDADPCTRDLCDLTTGLCHHALLDRDGDGHHPSRVEGVECPGDDCDDGDRDVYAGAPERCADGIDQDCDTVVDGLTRILPDIEVSRRWTFSTTFSASPQLVWTGAGYAISWTWFWSNRGCMYLVCHDGVEMAHLAVDGSPLVDETLLLDPVYLLPARDGPGWSGGEIWSIAQYEMTDLLLLRWRTSGTLRGVDVIREGVSFVLDNAWTGSSFGILQYTFGPAEETEQIVLTRVDSDGSGEDQVLDLPVPEGGSVRTPLVWAGSEYGLLWWDGAMDLDLYRIGADGSELNPPERVSEGLYEPGAGLDMVWTGSEYLLAYGGMQEDEPVVHVMAVDPDGIAALDDTILAENAGLAGLVWTGSQAGVGLYHDPQAYSFGMMNSEGELVGERIQVPSVESAPGVTWTGSEFGIAWVVILGVTEGYPEYGIRMNRMGFCQ